MTTCISCGGPRTLSAPCARCGDRLPAQPAAISAAVWTPPAQAYRHNHVDRALLSTRVLVGEVVRNWRAHFGLVVIVALLPIAAFVLNYFFGLSPAELGGTHLPWPLVLVVGLFLQYVGLAVVTWSHALTAHLLLHVHDRLESLSVSQRLQLATRRSWEVAPLLLARTLLSGMILMGLFIMVGHHWLTFRTYLGGYIGDVRAQHVHEAIRAFPFTVGPLCVWLWLRTGPLTSILMMEGGPWRRALARCWRLTAHRAPLLLSTTLGVGAIIVLQFAALGAGCMASMLVAFAVLLVLPAAVALAFAFWPTLYAALAASRP